jgi:predicted metal-dependent enzyme (double-stranded beta helix superfamily)
VATTSNYTMDAFIEDAKQIIAEFGHDGPEATARLFPLVQQAVWLDGLMDESKRVPPESGRSRFYHYRAPDDSLLIYVVEFVPGMPTPTHDHVNWGLIGVCGGKQLTTLHERVDDGSDPDYARLKLMEHRVRERGEVHSLVAPRDIHTIETVGNEASYSLHVIGGNLTRSHRNIFDVETCKISPVTGQRM